MQVEIIYRDGKLEFGTPVRVKPATLRFIVEVPDEDVDTASNPFGLPHEVVARARAMRARLDAVRDAPLPPDHELPEPNAKHQRRLEAFALRPDR